MSNNPIKWAALHQHSSYSLDAIAKPKQIIQKAIDVGLTAIALTDHGSLSGCIDLLEQKKKVGEKAKDLKIIFGSELYLNNGEGKSNSHLVVLCKNLDGWRSLIKATSEANKPENFYRKPRLTLEQLSNYTKGNVLAFSGHPGSDISNCLFDNYKLAYSARSYDEVKNFVKTDWKKDLFDKIDQYIQVFGKDCFWLEIQAVDEENFPAAILINKALRWAAKKIKLKCVASSDGHYINKENNRDQWVILSSAIGLSIPKITQKLISDDDDPAFAGFFRSNNYHIPSPEEIALVNTEEEMANAVEIAQECSELDIFTQPIIPHFACPDNLSADEYLKEICRQGWKEKINGKIPKEQKEIYAERIKYELDVLTRAKLSDYFLLIHDIVNYVKSQEKFIGAGRGSVAGCLTSYLSNITAVNPIEFNLIFERFYNAGRNTKDRISLCDIDLDIQASFRDQTIEYIKEKYGKERVGRISTFSKIMGRGCLKEVLRAWSVCTPKEMDKITRFIPDEAAIADDLQEMRDEGRESSVLQWALENNSKELNEWASLDKKTGQINGPYAKYFEQAIRLEGVHKSKGIHAAAVVVGNEDLSNICPISYRDGKEVIDFPMETVEKIGLIKLDLLGLKILDCIHTTENLIKNNWGDCI